MLWVTKTVVQLLSKTEKKKRAKESKAERDG